jgi:hypothetical protein
MGEIKGLREFLRVDKIQFHRVGGKDTMSLATAAGYSKSQLCMMANF